LKKIISIVVIFMMLINLGCAFGMENETPFSKNNEISLPSGIVNPDYVDYPDGTVDIQIEPPITDGTTIPDDSRSGIASTIWDIGLRIGSYFFRTAGNIILDVATIAFGLTEAHVNKNKGASVHLYHSYTYRNKVAKVYNQSTRTWKTYVIEGNREWYRHEFASFAQTNGFTATASVDFTADKGYPPIHVDVAPHYYDDNWIRDMAQYNYYFNRGVTEEYGWR